MKFGIRKKRKSNTTGEASHKETAEPWQSAAFGFCLPRRYRGHTNNMEMPQEPTTTVGTRSIQKDEYKVKSNLNSQSNTTGEETNSSPSRSQLPKQLSEKTTCRPDSSEASFTPANRDKSLVNTEPNTTATALSVKVASKANPPSKRRYSTARTKTTKTTKSGPPRESLLEDASVARMYDSIPPLEVTKLPRGGLSIETEAIGRVQVSHT